MALRPAHTPPRRRWTWRDGLLVALLVGVPALLDWAFPLVAPPHREAFWPVFILIADIVTTVVHAIGSATATAILFAWNLLRNGVSLLSKALKTGLWDAGRATAKLLRSTRALWDRVIKPALSWANTKLIRLERWLHDTFAPVLKWLHAVKARLDAFYQTFIRPITDTIDFIRALNRALAVFHIHVLSELDAFLGELENRIEQPFLWLRAKITELENWVDRIITLDGFFQRLTLLRSLSRYAPAWIHTFWTRQIGPPLPTTTPTGSASGYPTHEVLEDVNALNDYWLRGEGDHAAVIRELNLIFVQALKTVPDVRS